MTDKSILPTAETASPKPAQAPAQSPEVKPAQAQPAPAVAPATKV